MVAVVGNSTTTSRRYLLLPIKRKREWRSGFLGKLKLSFRGKNIWLGLHHLIFLLHDTAASKNFTRPPHHTIKIQIMPCNTTHTMKIPCNFFSIIPSSTWLTLFVKILLTIKKYIICAYKMTTNGGRFPEKYTSTKRAIIHLVIILFTPKKLSKIMKNDLKFYLSICNHFTAGQKNGKEN